MTLVSPAPILSRNAEHMFWLSRYLERAENLARLLEVTNTFSPASLGAQNWQSIIVLHHDEEAFAERYAEATAENVIRFYTVDDSHSTSLISCIANARTNAGALRAVISTKMWVQVNIMYNELKETPDEQLQSHTLHEVLSRIRRQCLTHAGIADSNLYRDEGLYFFLAGRHIERADQLTRLLDIKYHLLLPSTRHVGSSLDASQWFALLRSVSGYHAFRREHPAVISPATVIDFLLLNRYFPRTVIANVYAAHETLNVLQHDFGLGKLQAALSSTAALSQRLSGEHIQNVLNYGLHEYLDSIQLTLIDISSAISTACFTQ